MTAGDVPLAVPDADRLRALATQFPEIRGHAALLLEGPPPAPEPDLGWPIQDNCTCGEQPDDRAVPHRRGGTGCRAPEAEASTGCGVR